MKISKHISKGQMHKVFCEDFLIDEKISKKYRLFGVFDGCSSGKNSHLASALFGKIAVNVSTQFFMENDKLNLKIIIQRILIELKATKELMKFETDELLSTMILMFAELDQKTASIIVIGDGLLSVNNFITEINQNNQPNYLAYHLKSIDSENDFDVFFDSLLKYENIKIEDITISTDGINSFSSFSTRICNEFNIVEYFTKDNFLVGNSAMLARKHNIIKRKYNVDNEDDFAIIRIISD